MVRKSSKSAAKKTSAKRHTPKAAASSRVKAATRKRPPKPQDKRTVAKAPPTKAAKAPTPMRKPPQAAKPGAAAKQPPIKAQAAAPVVKPVATQPSGSIKAVAPKAVAAKKPVSIPPGHRPATVVARPMAAAVGKQPGQAIVAPATPLAANKKPVHQRHGFKTNEWIVYPAHGVGRIVGIEEQEIAGMSLELFVITFEKDKMTLRVPTGKSASVGMRKLAEEGIVKRAMETLKGRARIKRTMWSRRAQEYEAKINSGDLIAIAEVVRDLYRSESQPEQSYSERQLYEAALDRMAREIAAVDKLDERGAVQRITEVLSKSAKGRRLAAEEAEVKAA